MAFIENKISFDEKSTNKIINGISGLFHKFFNQPKWLIVVTIVTLAIGGVYFWYSHNEDKQSINELQEQIIQINEIVNSSLGVQELIYIITEIKILENVLSENFNECQYAIDAIAGYISKVNPNDPAVVELRSIQKRMNLNRETYNQHYSYIMKELDNVVNDDSNKE